MTMLPAPYESVPDDDLGAAVAATLTATSGALVALTLGIQAGNQLPDALHGLDTAGTSVPSSAIELVAITGGWALSVLLMALGIIALLLRRGRGALIFGALIGLGTTVLARYRFGYFTSVHPLEHGWVFFGGVVVIIAALLPATTRWIRGRRNRRSALPPLSTATALVPQQMRFGPAR